MQTKNDIDLFTFKEEVVVVEKEIEEEKENVQTYSIYQYDWSAKPSPSLLASTFERYNINTTEATYLDQAILTKQPNDTNKPYKNHINDFFKTCLWSPDGTCLLTNSEDKILRLFQVPTSVYEISSDVVDFIPSLGILEGESICDLTWFPSMNSQDPSTCCFLSSVRDHPVRLWDMMTGKVRASYCVVDHRERFIGPNTISFNLDGSKIYCGYENMIEIFDTQIPGNNTSMKIATIPNRKNHRKGQKGIISCIDFNQDRSGMYAAGSYSQSIGIYDERNHQLCLKLIEMQGNGVTQVKFSLDGNYLFSTSRQSNVIECWDIRNTGNILYELNRPGKTNQRISFDFDPTGNVLVSGDQYGNLLAYDLTTIENQDIESKPRLLHSWNAHEDIISSATINPTYPFLLASCSGQRKFNIGLESDDSDVSDNENNKEDDDEDEKMKLKKENSIDNSLKIWHLKGNHEWYSIDTSSTDQSFYSSELNNPVS
ncbi:unnamed protein product [Cunninghamella blakesleeana]